MKNDLKAREEILNKVRSFYRVSHRARVFRPGQMSVPCSGRAFDDDELVSLVDSALDFWLTSGRFVSAFEEKLAEFVGVRYAVLVNSGSSANLLAISALTSPLLRDKRLSPGDEVITTACGFPTTLNPIIQNNLIPVFVDVELGSYNIKVGDIEKAISPRTKAIFIPHTLGNPLNLEVVLDISEKYNLWFCEDNCDSLGSQYDKKHTGSFGHISTSSFYPAHHITTGEGGAVLTNSSLLNRIISSFNNWGRDCWCEPGRDNTCGKRFSWKKGELPLGYDHKYIFSHIGYNLKATEMQAAIGVAQLKKLPSFIEKRNDNFRFFYIFFRKYDKYFILPRVLENTEPAWFGFPLLVKQEAPFTRADITSYLEERKIATRVLFGGNLLKQPAYMNINCRIVGSLENTESVMKNFFWIGVYPGITSSMREYVTDCFESFFSKY